MSPHRSRAATLALALLLLPLAGCDNQRPAGTPRSHEDANTATPAVAHPVTLHFHPASYDGWLDAIPGGVALGAGRPGFPGELVRHLRPVRQIVCGTDVLRPHDVVDRRTVSRPFTPEDSEARDLRLFTDDRAAAGYQRRVLAAVRACPEEQHHTTTRVHTVTGTRLGEGAFTMLTTYRHGARSTPEPTVSWSDVVRVGNAVLATYTAAPYLPGESLDRALAMHHRVLTGVVAQMCVFTPDGCAVADPDIPAGFPLTTGFPDPDWAEGPGAGTAGPSRALPAPAWDLCGRTLALPEGRDRMAAQWSNPEDFRGRQLVTFANDQEAGAFLARLTAFYRSCPQQSTGFGYTGFQHVDLRSVGDEAYALYRVQEYQGSPGIGVDITQVTRVGRALLVDSLSNEGDANSVPTQLRRMTHASARIVAQMCAYADGGCGDGPEPRVVLGPDGVGSLELGMSAAQVRAAGARVVPSRNGTGCSAFAAVVDGRRVSGDLDPDIGVSMLTGEGLVTPEGVTVGTVRRLAWAAYDDGGRDHQLFVPSVPGRSHRIYRMELFQRRVAGLMLLATGQHCAS